MMPNEFVLLSLKNRLCQLPLFTVGDRSINFAPYSARQAEKLLNLELHAPLHHNTASCL